MYLLSSTLFLHGDMIPLPTNRWYINTKDFMNIFWLNSVFIINLYNFKKVKTIGPELYTIASRKLVLHFS